MKSCVDLSGVARAPGKGARLVVGPWGPSIGQVQHIRFAVTGVFRATAAPVSGNGTGGRPRYKSLNQ
eukprot:9092707-Pyramimonas_sp.AAC.2